MVTWRIHMKEATYQQVLDYNFPYDLVDVSINASAETDTGNVALFGEAGPAMKIAEIMHISSNSASCGGMRWEEWMAAVWMGILPESHSVTIIVGRTRNEMLSRLKHWLDMIERGIENNLSKREAGAEGNRTRQGRASGMEATAPTQRREERA